MSISIFRRPIAGRLSSGVAPLALLAATAAFAAPPAEDGQNEIVVTATKRATLIQDVPFSINAQTAQEIRRAHAETIEDLSRNVAGLTVQNLGPGQSQVAIRGVSSGQIARDQPGVKEQVGVYLDDSVISLSLFTPDLDFFDLDRVETLRGPQGTLFGSGSEGGTIRYITKQPKLDRVEGAVEAGLDQIDGGSLGGDVKGAINLPLGEKAAVRAVGYFTRYAGFIDALRPSGRIDRNVNDGYRAGGRVALLLKPADWITITPRILYQKIDVNGFNREDVFNIFANRFMTTPTTLADREQYLVTREKFRDKFLLVDNNINLDLGAVAVTSVTSYTHRKLFVNRDASTLAGSVSADLGFPASAIQLPGLLLDRTRLKQITQELRVASQGKGRFQWVVGGFYAHSDRSYTQDAVVPGYDAITDAVLGAGTSAAVSNGFGPDTPYASYLPYHLRQVALFAEGTFDITRRLHLTAGGRYYDYREDRQFITGGLYSNDDRRQNTTKSNGVTPRLILAADLSDRVTVNAQVSRGFRLGGINDALNLPLCSTNDAAIYGNRPNFKDETLWNYEGGVKARFGGVRFNAAVFYNQIQNMQVTLDAGTCSSRVVFNVPKAHAAGVEWEIAATPIRRLDLSLTGSATDSKIDSTVTGAGGTAIGGIRDGNRLPSVPKFQMAASGTYTMPLSAGTDAYLRATYQYVGSRYTQTADQENDPRAFVSGVAYGGATGTGATIVNLLLPSYQLVNLSAGLRLPRDLEISVYVNNLADVNPLLSFDRERGGRARLAFAVGQPRTFGVTVHKGF